MPHFSCLVGVPSGSHWIAQFGVDLVNLFNKFNTTRVADYTRQSLQLANVRSSVLPQNRLDLVKAAQDRDATHLLFLDSDQTFPPDLIHRLAAHHKLVVAANCVTKTIPASPTARAFCATDDRGVPVYTDRKSTGVEQVWRIGTGVMLVHMSVFKKVPYSAWEMVFLQGPGRYQGEDWRFCQLCEEAGINLYIDHDVSKHVGHVGLYEYTTDVVGEIQYVEG